MQSFQNHFLIAMPSLDDPLFKRSVAYICEHNTEGAMAIVINHPLDVKVADLLQQLQIEYNTESPAATAHVCAGGPVQHDRGFVLHTAKEGYASSMHLNDGLMVTTSKDILFDLTTDNAPEKFILALGYAGWTAGQLEQEIADNAWLIIPADSDIIFDLTHAEKWQSATAKIGIKPWQLTNEAGHA
ncbi:putative transcriptional regulator [Rheinheimera pacifica]|uniref:YqgE/AlgH family protein n=1 Tax=Rheinheimera pacifica TaxID=173990 RepID=UPI002167EBE3|nr:YqgE/AlgH family protein [Rheinheimera pacifica]MCS4307359.1 putative transcriptional regulator [Rheinheimera pacifica]